MKKATKLIIAAMVFGALSLTAHPEALGDHDLSIWEVWGDGSPGTATLIRGPDGTVVLYDAGQTRNFAARIKGILDEEGIADIDYVIMGHYDNDHCGGLDDLSELLGGVARFGTFFDRGGNMRARGTRDRLPDFLVDDYLPLANSGNRETPVLGPDGAIDLGNGATLTFLSRGAPDNSPDDFDNRLEVYDHPDVATTSENNKSITALITYGGFDMYIGSDAEGDNEKAVDDVITETLERSVDIMLVDHHGADTHDISSIEFFRNIDPEVALISCWNNRYGHPRQQTVANLHDFVETGEGRQTILRIDPGDEGHASWAPEDMFPECHTTNSHILITTDGRTYTVSGDGIVDQDLVEHDVDDPVEDVPEAEIKTDIVVIVDRSNSMNLPCLDGAREIPKIEAARKATRIFVDIIEPDDGHRLSIVRFGERVEPFIPPITLEELTLARLPILHPAIEGIHTGEDIGLGTCYGAALREALAQLTDPRLERAPRQIVHFLTDGDENRDPRAEVVYPDLVRAGIEIHSTAFGDAINPDVLADMEVESGGSFAQIEANDRALTKRSIVVAGDATEMEMPWDPTYTIGPWQPAKERISVDASTRKLKFILFWEGQEPRRARMAVVSPDKLPLKPGMPGVRESVGNGYTILHVDLTRWTGVQAEGTWRVTLSTGEEFTGTKMEVDLVVLSDSDIEYAAEVEPGKTDPRSVRLLCRMVNRGKPVTKAYSTVSWTAPLDPNGHAPDSVELALFDDGKHGDGRAWDGFFGADLYLKEPGCHSFHFVSKASVPGNEVSAVYPRREAIVTYTVRR